MLKINSDFSELLGIIRGDGNIFTSPEAGVYQIKI